MMPPMHSTPPQELLRVRLADASWRSFNHRAASKSRTPSLYADMVFRYVLHDRTFKPAAPGPRSMDDEEEIYFELAIAPAIKRQLAGWSEVERTGLAAFSGALLAAFMHRFERDPRDLGTIHHLASRLEQFGRVSKHDLREAIHQLEHNSGVRLPPGYLAKWLQTRVSALVQSVESEGACELVTAELIDGILLEETTRRL